MSKKKMLILSCILLVCIILFAYIFRIYRINARQVEKMVLYSYHAPAHELSTEESAEFIKLYHSSKYEGSDIGYGTTPYYSITVYFRNGDCLEVHEYGEHNFWVCRESGDLRVYRHYISSEELDVFMAELAEKYCYSEP